MTNLQHHLEVYINIIKNIFLNSKSVKLLQNITNIPLFWFSSVDIQTRPTFVREELTEADLDKMVTDTVFDNLF